MKYYKYLIVLCCLSSILFAQEYYPISAYQCEDTTWFQGAGEDSLGLNMIHYTEWPINKDALLAALDAAHNKNLDVILGHATKDSSGRGDLLWYCHRHWGNWEAEDNSNFMVWDKGNGEGVVYDTLAHNDSAFHASIQDGEDTLRILKTVGDNVRLYKGNSWEDKLIDIIFHLRCDSLHLASDSTDPVCLIYVTKPASVVLQDTVLRVCDFDTPDQYRPCTLSYCLMSTYSHRWLYYAIKLLPPFDLWCDYIEVKDRYVDSLLADHYYTILRAIATIYDNKPAVEFHYLMDEPSSSYLPANAHVMGFLEDNGHQPGFQAVSYRGPDWYRTYIDLVDPYVLPVNYYPLRGAWDSIPTPEDSGVIFQGRLDTLCIILNSARVAARQNGIPFWFICQSFGKYSDSTSSTASLREPTPRELKCMIWLGLAHGAEGIDHFLYRSFQESSGDACWYDSGLTHLGVPRYPLWTAAKEMNFALRSIGSRLLSLESDKVFKVSDSIPSDCFIADVSDSLMQIGTFYDEVNEDDVYFIIVNRYCLPSDTVEVTVTINSFVPIYLYDCLTEEAIACEWTEPHSPTRDIIITLLPGQGRLLRVIPLEHEFLINQGESYTNLPNVALRTKATSSLDIDSMKIWQYYGDTLIDSTIWIPYDTTYIWYLWQGEGNNEVFIQYKVGGFSESPAYHDTIMFDTIPPSGSFIINDDDKFTNSTNVIVANSFSDEQSEMAKMFYDNEYFKNIVKNSEFNDTSHWVYDNAAYDTVLKLFEIPMQQDYNYFFQSIPAESLETFDNDTMRLSVDLVGDGFVGCAWFAFAYIYGLPEDSIFEITGVFPYGDSIAIPPGTKAKVSHYNLYSYFCYHPDPPPGKILHEVRVGIFIDAGAGNSGRLFIDNLRTDVISAHNEFTYDSLKNCTLMPGNGVRYVYGQFTDGSGNETEVQFDSIIVDTTKPTRRISSPQNGQIVNGRISIMGWAYDYADPEQHFKEYELKYRRITSLDTIWYGVRPESLFYEPVYGQSGDSLHPQIINRLARWNTRQVTNTHGNGWYFLRLAVRDSAGNYADTMISVRIRNLMVADTAIHFPYYVYGLAAQKDIYVGEIETGMIHQYSTDYQLLNSFELSDSCGIGFPLAMNIDKNNKLWVTNIISNLINRFTNQGNPELHFGGGFSLPSGITPDNSGNVWVTDRLHHKIKKFDSDGNFLYQFGRWGFRPGKIRRPIGIGLYDNKLYVADSKNRRISVFDTMGNFIEVIGDNLGLLKPFGLVMDSTGCFFVSDFLGDRVIAFDPYGNPLFEIDSILDAPSGIALSSDANILYISDTKHKRVLAFIVRDEPTQGGGPQSGHSVPFDRPIFYIYPSIFLKQLNIRLQGLHDAEAVELEIYDVTGRLVRQFDHETIRLSDLIAWDGTDDLKRKLSSGVYFVRLAVNPAGDASGCNETRKAILLK